jgi:5-formyltetrahydrofolate cyclo-ligase
MRQSLRGPLPPDRGVFTAASRWVAAHPAARTLAVFAPIPGEIDLLPLLVDHPDRRWVFPRVAGERLDFHTVTRLEDDLVAGGYGLMEPRNSLPLVALPEIDAFFCPGLAFDPRGGRLGRGRGFYDRALAAARADAWKLGICQPLQIVPDTFAEPHDIAMDEVLSG